MNNQYEKMQKLAFGKIIIESETPHTLTESTLRDRIKEIIHSSLGEAKKKKKEPEDVAPQEDTVDIDMDMDTEIPSDTIAPSSTDEIDIDPKVKAIQDALSKALANAKALGDEKLTNQIGNTITMLVRTQVVGQQQVAENEDLNEYIPDFELEGENYDLNKAFQNSPTEYSYNEVLSIIESYEDEDILNEFKAKFPEGKSINKESYYNFAKSYIDDMSEISYIKANWISLSDEDVFEKAGLV